MSTGSTRRRGALLEDAILDAAVVVLRGSGYDGMTMDRVARQAGTNKNAIYRRWPSRPALGVAAYSRLAESRTPAIDTGTLRSDALALLTAANATWSSAEGAILRDLLTAAAHEPGLLELLRDRVDASAMARAWEAALDRAVTRGEAPPEAAHPLVAALPMKLLRAEYQQRGAAPVPDQTLVDIVDELFLPLVRGRAVATTSAPPAGPAERRPVIPQRARDPRDRTGR